MADQTHMNGTSRPTTPAQGVMHNMLEFVSDVLTLGELQAKLFAEDGRVGLKQLVVPVLAFIAGVTILLSCVPIALVTIALLLVEFAAFTAAQAFLISLAGGIVFGLVIAVAAALYLRKGSTMFDRSFRECDANVRWVKGVLGHFSKAKSTSTPSRF